MLFNSFLYRYMNDYERHCQNRLYFQNKWPYLEEEKTPPVNNEIYKRCIRLCKYFRENLQK